MDCHQDIAPTGKQTKSHLQVPLRLSFHAAMAALPLLLAGCDRGIWANLAVLGTTLGIFLGTVFLNRGAGTHSILSSASRGGATSTASRS